MSPRKYCRNVQCDSQVLAKIVIYHCILFCMPVMYIMSCLAFFVKRINWTLIIHGKFFIYWHKIRAWSMSQEIIYCMRGLNLLMIVNNRETNIKMFLSFYLSVYWKINLSIWAHVTLGHFVLWTEITMQAENCDNCPNDQILLSKLQMIYLFLSQTV